MSPVQRRYFRARHILLPIAVLLALWVPRMFKGDYQVDTALYAAIAHSLYQSENWWSPAAADIPYFNKPPLAFWIHGAFLEVIGIHRWSILLPQVLAASACLAIAASITRTLAGRRAALFAALFLATNLAFFRYSGRLILDYWTMLFLLASVWLCVRASVAPSTRRALLLAACAGIPIGLALLTKPIFPLLAIPIMAIWFVVIRKPRPVTGLVPAAAVAVALAAPWHLAMHRLHGQAFLDNYLGRELVERALTTRFRGEPWYAYFTLLFIHGQPWIWFVPIAAFQLRTRAPLLSRRVRDLSWLIVVWCAAWLLCASLVADKRIRYIMHLWPMLMMVPALGLTTRPFRRITAPRWIEPAALAVFLVCSVGTATNLIRLDPPKPELLALYQFVRDHRNEDIWSLTLWPPHNAAIYLETGVWPKHARDWNDRPMREPPQGAIAITRPEHGVALREGDELLFEQGKLKAIRLGPHWSGAPSTVEIRADKMASNPPAR